MDENLSEDQIFFNHFTDQIINCPIGMPQNVLQCRICGKLLPQDEAIDIFSQPSDILEKMHFFLFIFVYPNDHLSKHICLACQNHLDCYCDLSQNRMPSESQLAPDIFEDCNLVKEEDIKIDVLNEPIYMLPKPIKHEANVDLFSPATFNGSSPFPNPPNLVKQKDFEDNSSSGDTLLFGSIIKSPITCDVCNNIFISNEELSQHTCTSLSDTFCCHTCDAKFAQLPMYQNHLEVCQQNFLSGHNNKRLDTSQKCSGAFVCDICNAKFSRFNLLEKHQLKHKPRSEWTEKCNLCDLSFERNALLVRHLKTMHADGNADPSPWKCRYCGKHLMTKLSLGIHERIHTGAKPYACEWCGQCFRSRANLLQHHPKHTSIKKHKCDECGKSFSRKSFVTAHMRVHTGERPFSCGVCERKFTQIGDMRRHEKKHKISIKRGKTYYTVIDINNNLSSDSVCSVDSDDKLSDSEIALNVKVIQDN